MPDEPSKDTIAAVDLGSNSFHLLVARNRDGRLQVIDRLREQVRLGAGLMEDGTLAPDVQARALDCLQRFSQRLRGMRPECVRAVGTNTLRRARDAGDFLAAAEQALGYPIGVIGGIEEARLIYLGVAHGLADAKQRLVIDIGGGSTELILGVGFAPLYMESLEMGCVSMSRRWFGDGHITQRAVDQALIQARLEIEPVEAVFRDVGWQDCVGASGTIRAAAAVVAAQGWTGPDEISRAALDRLLAALVKTGHVDRLSLEGLNQQRAAVFPGGVVILRAVFEAMGIEAMRVSDKALREGLVHDLMGRIRHEDVRNRAVADLAQRYHVITEHAAGVRETALFLLQRAAPNWELDGGSGAQWLSWAAQLHEIGLDISHDRYHHHGAYIAEHADIPGFSRQEQRLLACLIRAHRRKFPVKLFKELPAGGAGMFQQLAVLLRLAVLLHRGRVPAAAPAFELQADKRRLALSFPAGWLDQHPLTRADLAQEAGYLQAAGFELTFA